MANSTHGKALISASQIKAMVENRTLLLDNRRQRPQYFDGRFQAAKDLTREQRYFLTSQTDLSYAIVFGVVEGLKISRQTGANLSISPGKGVTPKGELVVLPESDNGESVYSVSLNNVPLIQELDAAFGLSPLPRESAQNLSGLYVLGLRAVEFTTNTLTTYPKTVGGTASAYNGDIVDAVAVTLVPYVEENPSTSWNQRRSQVARKIFVEGVSSGTPANVLPLAMVALNIGQVEWVDSYLVRRNIEAEFGQIIGLEKFPKALRGAHFHQFEEHFSQFFPYQKPGSDIVSTPQTALTQGKNAASYFQALPPAGPFPKVALNVETETQSFLPSSINVEVTFIPEDELPAILEDSLLLPPIDLMASQEELQEISVLVLAPLKRGDFYQNPSFLSSIKVQHTASRASSSIDSSDLPSQWKATLKDNKQLWYVRKRTFPKHVDHKSYSVDFSPSIVEARVLYDAATATSSEISSSTEGSAPGEYSEPIAEAPLPELDERLNQLDQTLQSFELLSYLDNNQEQLSSAAKILLYKELCTDKFVESKLLMRLLIGCVGHQVQYDGIGYGQRLEPSSMENIISYFQKIKGDGIKRLEDKAGDGWDKDELSDALTLSSNSNLNNSSLEALDDLGRDIAEAEIQKFIDKIRHEVENSTSTRSKKEEQERILSERINIIIQQTHEDLRGDTLGWSDLDQLDGKLNEFNIISFLNKKESRLNRAARFILYKELSTPKFENSELLMRLLIACAGRNADQLERGERLDRVSMQSIVNFFEGIPGDGIQHLEKNASENLRNDDKLIDALTVDTSDASGYSLLADLDFVGREIREENIPEFTNNLLQKAKELNAQNVVQIVKDIKKIIEDKSNELSGRE